VTDGRADLGIAVPAYKPAEFALNEIFSMPMASRTQSAVSIAMRKLREEYPAFDEELAKAGVRHLASWPSGETILHSDYDLSRLDLLNGKSVRVTGKALSEAFLLAGASPIPIAASEMYEALNTDVVNVMAYLVDSAADYRMDEVADKIYVPGLGNYVSMMMMMSEDTFKDLPPELQNVVTEVSDELIAGKAQEILDTGMVRKCDDLAERGRIDVFEFWAPEETEKWLDLASEDMQAVWLKSADAAGVANTEEILNRYLKAIEEAEGGGTIESLETCVEKF
jgi:TRAP-type C4-dicarboxylate transport system substrate-binding protein